DVAQAGSTAIRHVAPDGTVTTVAVKANPGLNLAALAHLKDGSLLTWDDQVNKLVTIGADGTAKPWAGNGQLADRDGTAQGASFKTPGGIAVAHDDDTVWVTEVVGNVVRRIAPDGTVTTVAGRGPAGADGKGASAGFAGPGAIAVGPDGSAYVADAGGLVLRKV